MERRISIPRTPEVLFLEERAAQRFRLRSIGWAGFVLFGVLSFTSVLFLLFQFDMVFLILWLLFWLYVTLDLIFAYCHAGRYTPITVKYIFGFFTLLARDCGFLPSKLTSPMEAIQPVEVGFSSVGITLLMSGDDPVSLPWNRFCRLLWQFSDCWMLISSDLKMFMPVPTAVLDEECKNYIVAQIENNGGKIKVNPGLGVGLIWSQKAN